MELELKQTAYWDEVADKKVFSHEIDWKFLTPLLKKKSQLLDYGCGYGRLSATLSEKGFVNVTGIDSSLEMIKRAKS